MTELAIDITDLSKAYNGKNVVQKISLKIKRGTIYGFLGSNGSGKTTTIRLLCGLIDPSDGQGTCLGLNFRTQNEAIKSRIGYMPQKFCLYEKLTIEENLKFIGQLYQLVDLNNAIDRVIELLHLEPYRHLKAGLLSEGWKQRLSLGAALVHNPELLFLDEPTAGLDPKARIEFWDYLHKISLERGTTILVSTHYMDEAEKCTELGYIHFGKLLYSGSTEGIISFSKVISFVSDTNRRHQLALSKMIANDFPSVMVTINNNSLRISSKNNQTLSDLIKKVPEANFKATIPSMEDAFMGMIP